MPYIRKVRLGRAIHLAVSSCTTTRFCGRSRGLQVFRSHPRGSRGCTMQDPASEVPRIILPRIPLHKGRAEDGRPDGACIMSSVNAMKHRLASSVTRRLPPGKSK
jgi:hypothetical protein